MSKTTKSNKILIKEIFQMFDRYKNYSSCDTLEYLLAGYMLNNLYNRLAAADGKGEFYRREILNIHEEANRIIVDLQIP